MNEAKQAHVGLVPLVGGAVLPAYDSPRLRSAARPPVSVGDLDRQPADSHPQPLNENRSIVFWDSFFDRHVLGTVIRVRSRISLLLLARRTSLKQSLSHLSVALPGT